MSSPVPRRPSRAPAFTLIETALATVIVGVGFTAAMALFAACTRANDGASRLTVAAMLAGHVQSMTAGLPFAEPEALAAGFGPEPGEVADTFDDLDDFDGAAFDPPRDGLRRPLPDLDGYAQRVTVRPVDPARPSRTLVAPGDAVRVTVRVTHADPGGPAVTLCEVSWLRMR